MGWVLGEVFGTTYKMLDTIYATVPASWIKPLVFPNEDANKT
jgi:hypothetical protein